ncbi:DUF4870 domain-containing protein [Natronosporangium hydrolyticum]|uniref:DUF4870 domain-containing protein n=1 Tax=Natronosporangium hydrolyticum TaxID=2811111 RepID=A0A895YN31_9ACTN|nr:DUF4870 domain-containing protein [Natronosporangium hydrolyticum]QSB16096.1 DUF4870 domain-containing protein [Natronosporangium hydrolyticum]
MTSPPQPPPAPPPPPPGGAAPPPGYANGEEKTWALVAHFGGGAGMLILGGMFGWVAPLIALVAKGKESPTVRAHAVQALNFQLTWSIVGLLGWLTLCLVIGALLLPAAIVVSVVFSIIAGIKANDGHLYNYQLAIKMVK